MIIYKSIGKVAFLEILNLNYYLMSMLVVNSKISKISHVTFFILLICLLIYYKI